MNRLWLGAVLCATSACASVETTPVQQPVSQTQAEEAQRLAAEALPAAPSLKRKVAVGRFTNATRYGRALLYDDERDPLAEQASDIVSNRLAETDAFIVVERRDLELLEDEADLTGKQMDLIGVDTLLVGSVTEFGRKTEGKAGFLSSTKKQAAEAVVEVRMIDAKTGVVFATATGTGSASTEAGETMGFGTRAAFDATLTDKALSSAIADLMTAVMQNVTARPWQADILKVESERAFISGGRSQGLKVGDELAVMREGEAVRSERSGMVIRLPGEEVARVRVTGFFGDTELAEGAVVTLLSGRLPTSGEGHLVEEVRS